MSVPTIDEVIQDLQSLSDKGYGKLPLMIYCKNCDCSDEYTGAAAGSKTQATITINEG